MPEDCLGSTRYRTLARVHGPSRGVLGNMK
jgi:hypothetical protein